MKFEFGCDGFQMGHPPHAVHGLSVIERGRHKRVRPQTADVVYPSESRLTGLVELPEKLELVCDVPAVEEDLDGWRRESPVHGTFQGDRLVCIHPERG